MERHSGFHPENEGSIPSTPTMKKPRIIVYTVGSGMVMGPCDLECHKCYIRFECYTTPMEPELPMLDKSKNT